MRCPKKWLALALFASPGVANAACSVSVTPLVETYNPASTSATNRSATVTVNCTLLSGLGGYVVSASPGVGSYNKRVMAGPGANLPYQLYIDAAYTTVWGDGTGGTSTVNGTSLVPVLGGSFSFTVWSSTPALAPIPAGTFSDNIIVTVSY